MIISNEDGFYSYTERLITEVVKREHIETKRAIRDYFIKKYPKENLKFNFLDQYIVDEIIDLGISEYTRRYLSK